MLTQYEWRDPDTLIAPMDPSIAAYTGAFGGWVAAHALLAAVRVAADPEADPLSVSIDFLRGIGPGEVASRAETLHATRSLRFLRVTTSQGTEQAAVSSVILARRRPTDIIDSVVSPKCALPESLQPVPTQGLPVTWVQQFDLRFAHGGPGTRSPEMRTLVWVRLRDRASLDYTRLIAIADTPLPRIFTHYGELSKISTVSLAAQFLANAAEVAALGNDFVLTEAWCTAARHGYYDQQTRVWSRAGQLLVSSSQVVWFNVAAKPPA